MGQHIENAGFLLLIAFLVLLALHLYRKIRHRKGFFWEICIVGILGLLFVGNMGAGRNSLSMGPILFTSHRPSPLVRMFYGNTKVFAIENRGKETLLTSVSASSDRVITRFTIFEGEEYLKEDREGPKEWRLSMAIPAGKRVAIETSEEVVLEPQNVHSLQFGVHGYYARGSELPPVRLK